MNIVLYSSGCPMCRVCQAKLDQANIKYTYVEDKDTVVQIGQDNGIKSAPILVVDGTAYDYKKALAWIKEQKNG